MPEKTEPLTTTTQFAKPDRTVEFGAGQAGDGTAGNRDDQTIQVRALRTFHKEENMRGKMVAPGEEFDCPRGRAAQLRANGLIEYVDAAHAKEIHGEEGAAKIEERVAREQAMGKIDEKDKGSPLRNPELKLAEVDPKDDPRSDKAKK